MMEENKPAPEKDPAPPPAPVRRNKWTFVAIVVVVAILSAAIAGLLVNIFQRKQEAKNRYLKFVNVTETTTDPAVWAVNWPREYEQYLKTANATHTRYGGSEGMTSQKLDRDPWLKTAFAGYAFSLDYRDRRGHAYMLADQTATERLLQKPQPGACLHCHASIIPTYRRVGAAALGVPEQTEGDVFNWPAVLKGFDTLSLKPYVEAYAEVVRTPDGSGNAAPPAPAGMRPAGATTREALAAHAGKAHPVSCVDCHNPDTMQLRVTRPGFMRGIQALATSDDAVPHLPSVEAWRRGDRKAAYDPNRDASRQEMRSFVCGQCHVEYYCGPKEVLFFPWHKGLKVEQIEAHYDGHRFPDGTPFMDWSHAVTGTAMLKAQHPEFEMWSQGIHARSGVACADCHMPYMREGAMKVSDHWVRSPLLMVNQSCQTCHRFPEQELQARILNIQEKTHAQVERAGTALTDLIKEIQLAKANGATGEQLKGAQALHRKAQWRLDFVYAENSMGFHAPQETMRVLAESIDYSRQGQLEAQRVLLRPGTQAATQPMPPVEGVTPTEQAPVNPK